jgi:hypothetical protein
VETTKKIWFHINRWIHESLFTPSREIGRMASRAVKEFVRCNETKLKDDINSDTVQTTWMTPPPEWFKIHCDATVDGKKKGVIGEGLII